MADEKKKKEKKERGIKVQKNDTSESWVTLIKQGNLPLFKQCVEQDPSILKQTDHQYGANPLHWACACGHADIVEFLLENNAPFAIDAFGQTPFHIIAHLKQHAQTIVNLFTRYFEIGDLQRIITFKNKNDLSALGIAIQQENWGALAALSYLNQPSVWEVNSLAEADAYCPRSRMRVIWEPVGQQTGVITPVFGSKLHARIEHRSKDKTLKYQYPLSDVHHQLRVTHHSTQFPKGNTIVVDMTFEILIEYFDNGEKIAIRDHILIPLQVPGYFSMTRSGLAGGDAATYPVLKHLYQHGRRVRGIPADTTHGHDPKYDLKDTSGTRKQYIYHTEQTMAAYLCTPEAARNTVDKLIASIHAKYAIQIGAKVKVYTAALHIHSDKTPCGPCEFVLVGLQNAWQFEASVFRGFAEYLQEALEEETRNHYQGRKSSPFRFIFPGASLDSKKKKITPKNVPLYKKGIRSITTYTADTVDGDGKGHKQPRQASKPVMSAINTSQTPIHTGTRENISQLFVTNFCQFFNHQIAFDVPSDAHRRTFFLSGSDQTPPKDQKKKGQSETSSLSALFSAGLFVTPPVTTLNFPPGYVDVNVPADHSCLFWSIALAVLMPKIEDTHQFSTAYHRLFGGMSIIEHPDIKVDDAKTREAVRQFLRGHEPNQSNQLRDNPLLSRLVRYAFRRKLVHHMNTHFHAAFWSVNHLDRTTYLTTMRQPSAWGGENEIIAASQMLNITIHVSGGQTHSGAQPTEAIRIARIADENHYHYGLSNDVYQRLAPVQGEVEKEEKISTKLKS